ncbi:cadherin-like beta sandwich domain-containing protein [Candidatus Poriferisocius sp.]|uniref:cadherin-like beta sandwich domain-containing protein n=1 Tax=Candidatus Poriferisocius sp. TaxID=3101276 RepID=UPI003B026FA5
MHIGLWAAIAVLAAGLGFVLFGGLASTDSSITVTQGDFELTCPTGTVAENATLACTLTNTAEEAKPWPVVAILHLSTDDDRALVRGTLIDVSLGTPSPGATIDGGVTWIGDTLVGYSRFDWSGTAGAKGATGSSRTVNVVASHDSFDEDSEKFYVALGPDGSRGVGLLYNNKTGVTLTDDDGPSTDTSLSNLKLSAGQSHTLSPTQGRQSRTVAYEVTEATLTAASARGTVMTMSASFNGSTLDLDGRGATSIGVISEEESAAVPLSVGTTTVTLTVTAEDGTTTGTHTVSIVRSALGDGVDTVAVSLPSFTLTCPAEVAKATNAQCTLRATSSAGWPVVAIIHSSADGASRALVAEDPIIPDTDPAYSKDVSLGNQQPARKAFNHGYGELFSGGSRTLYRTYGYEKFDWSGTASAGDTRTVTIQIHDTSGISGVAAEIFYVALAPSDYTGLSQLVDNKVPILIKSPTAVTGVAVQNVASDSADVVVETANPAGTLYLRYRAGTSGAWTETEEEVTSSPAQFSIAGLTADTKYQVQASFDEDFSAGVVSGSFTTLAPSVTGVAVQNIESGSAEVVVQANNPAGMLYLRYRAGTSGAWTETEEEVTSSPARISIAGLNAGTEYQVQASFDEDFSAGVISESFSTLVPSVTGVEVASSAGQDSWYELSNMISVRVAFSEAVVVTGSPTLGIDMDPASWGRKDAVYASGSGTAELTFTYQVTWPNYSSQGIAVLANTLALNGGTIQAAAGGADADLAHSGLNHDPAHKVDWRRVSPALEVIMVMTCQPAQGQDGATQRWTVAESQEGKSGVRLTAGLIAGSCSVTSPTNAVVSWSLSGNDADRFEISDDGTLSFAEPPDFEAPADSDGDNVYEVTISGAVGDQTRQSSVAVEVTDVDEAPPTIITIDPPSATVAVPVHAMVSGNELTLVFTKELAAIDDAAARALRYAFVVDGGKDRDGNAVDGQAPTGFAAESNLLTLTLGAAVAVGDEATVRYVGAAASNALLDSDGTAVADFNVTLTAAQR